MNLEHFESNCLFYDAIHFPHGFNRAGVFTRTEAEVLTRCGYVIKQLSDYSKEPESDEQKHMLAVIHGEAEAESFIERTWMKYIDHIQNRRLMRFYGLSSGDSDVEYSDESSW
ncbi:MAG: DUF413 domain-containing protein [Oleiphilaceae bacterium]|nr:DUF413 domain-containing protein [Oleiphilaceae bacterium]